MATVGAVAGISMTDVVVQQLLKDGMMPANECGRTAAVALGGLPRFPGIQVYIYHHNII